MGPQTGRVADRLLLTQERPDKTRKFMTFNFSRSAKAAPLACAAAALLALAGTPVLAAGPAPHGPPTFDDIDSNHDGTISQSEFDAFKAAHPMGQHGRFGRGDHGSGPPPGGMERGGFGWRHPRPMGLKRLDADGDDKISFAEFEAPMKARFDRLDVNHDGTIDASEMPKWRGRRGDSPPPPPGDVKPAP
jgi:hypothetical protein